ncbi:MAG: hypothetical protein LQ343_004408 [Gyalolechia ehrenbergii]|nr:MAG: hypothetical protein LQ343_004408 [Gyalolechia ehrenbergii]
MRSATIISVLLATGALATPVAKWLEERALVVEKLTTTTVVWVTAGQPMPTSPVTAPKQAAVVAGHKPHHRPHAHAAAAQPAPAAPALPPSSPAAVAPVPEKAAEPVVEQPQSPPAAPPSSKPESDSGSNSGSSSAPTSYVDNLDTTSDTYKALVLQHHNIHRANHSADDLTWDDTLAKYAEQTAKTCVWAHDLSPGGGGYGQNIAAGTPANNISAILTNSFYNDEMELFPGYGSDSVDMSNFEKWGHFSQMLWQITQKVGCYTYTCSPAGAPPLDCNPSTGQSYLENTGCGNGGMNAIFTVCNYSPPGNYGGQYSKVGAPTGKPFVRGHMDNPVAWQMWGDESIALAKTHNRLLFLSIGYAACHWCHVMERESFSSPEIAQILNSHFIPIKIDREERPDVDAIYMNYVQATTGSGGWPLNVFITPDLEPVFGGTYWPGPNHSMTAQGTLISQTVGFLQILGKMRDVWTKQESRCRESAKQITRQLREFAEEGVHSRQQGEESDVDGLELDLLEETYQHFLKKYDNINGGFSIAPKFPTPVNLQFLLRLGKWPQAVMDIVGDEECSNAAGMVINTLRAMARGGIRDQIGYGFSRYSVTKDWSLPHFEKMLYDQAQLLDVYLDAFLTTRDPEMLGAVYDIATYLTTPPMAAPSGGFYSAEDADSYPTFSDKEKREGAYYVWTLREFRSVLGDRDGNICARFYGVLADGNVARENDPHDEFINQNVLKVTTTPAALAKQVGMAEREVITILKEGRKKLREHREKSRPRPALDDKIVVAWNGLAIGALARVGAALEEIDPDKAKTCKKAAEDAASFIRKELFDEDAKTLYRVYREGRGDTPGFCDDYAFLIHGLIDLYEATFEERYLEFADTLQTSQTHLFHDPSASAFFTTSPSSPHLLLHLKSGMDAAEPSSNSISASNLHRLASLLNHDPYRELAISTVAAFEAEVEQFPWCFAGMLGSVVMARCGVQNVVVVGEEPMREVQKIVRGTVKPGRTIARGDGKWIRGRNELVGHMDREVARVMVCEGGMCREGMEYV